MPDTDRFEIPETLTGFTWFWDPLHCPRPLPPLAAELWQTWIGMGSRATTIVVNGYGFMGFGVPGKPAAPIPPSPYADPLEAWHRHFLPMARAADEAARNANYDVMSDADLASAIDPALISTGRGWEYTMAAMGQASVPHDRFLAFCERTFGASADVRAMTMLEGLASAHTSGGDALAHLAQSVAGNEALVAALVGGDLDAVRAAPGGAAFASTFADFLREHGGGVHTFFSPHLPTWAEEPSAPLKLVARYAQHPESSPLVAHARSAERRAAAIAAAEAELTDPADLAEFRALLAGAAGYVQVIEERAHWQLSLMGAARVVCMALGRRLAERGAIAEPNDVFLLHVYEIEDAAAGKARLPSLVEQRQRAADIARWREIRPPNTLGQPLPPSMNRNSAFSKIFGVTAPRVTGETITGEAASLGVVTGRARIALDLSDAEAMEDGDILIVPFTSPPWTPYFSVAAAVVTDAGGVLSHAAIEAREYGIPAVVATQVATRMIPDGARVEVDGSAGTVRILSH